MFSQKVLLAYDATEGSQHALEKAKQLAVLNPNVSVHILYVTEHPKIAVADAYINKPNLVESDFDQEIMMKINEAERELSLMVTCTSERLISDNPAIEIIEQSKALNCDLIIIGSRGLGGFKKLFLGSVSNYVVNNATVPVLVIK